MFKLKNVTGLLVAVGLVLVAQPSFAVDVATNTATIDSLVLGPAWANEASPDMAILSRLAQGTVGGSAYIADATNGLGAFTNTPDTACVNLIADDGSFHADTTGAVAGGDTRLTANYCGTFSSSPQTAIASALNNVTGNVTQDVDFAMQSGVAGSGEAMTIAGGSFFTMAADRTVNVMASVLDQTVEFTAGNGFDGTLAGGDGERVIVNAGLAGYDPADPNLTPGTAFTAGVTADEWDTTVTGANAPRDLDFSLSITEVIDPDITILAGSTGAVSVGGDQTAATDYLGAGNMPPGFQ